MRKKVFLGALLAGAMLTGYGFLQPREASAGDGGKNLKVLPATMSKADIKKLMKGVADSLGVQCDFCHDTDAMEKDTEKKEVARAMMKMAMDINKNYFKGEQRVTCMTCHNGKKEPAGGKK